MGASGVDFHRIGCSKTKRIDIPHTVDIFDRQLLRATSGADLGAGSHITTPLGGEMVHQLQTIRYWLKVLCSHLVQNMRRSRPSWSSGVKRVLRYKIAHTPP